MKLLIPMAFFFVCTNAFATMIQGLPSTCKKCVLEKDVCTDEYGHDVWCWGANFKIAYDMGGWITWPVIDFVNKKANIKYAMEICNDKREKAKKDQYCSRVEK